MTEGHTERLESALAGRYKIERKLGEGGMASVYLAEDLKHERKVALKILRPELAAVIGAERFLSEIKTTANLQHPHILALFDSGSADGYLYYVMPFIEGETLREKLDREKQLGVEESISIARDVADALDYAHRHGVIHRDIKPGNILLHDGRPVVADFGIALAVSAAGGGRMTETGLSLGTPHYMSPEQASADRDLSPKSDLYSLGCVLYEMLAGQPPHSGPSAQSILVHILTKDVTPLTELRHTVPANVGAAVAKSIEKLPADRFETAKDFMDALGDKGFAYQPRTPTAAPATISVGAAPTRGRPWLRDPRSVAALVALVLVAAWGTVRGARVGGVTDSVAGVPLRTTLEDLAVRSGAGNRIAISRDGSQFAFASDDSASGVSRIFVRTAEQREFREIPGTEGATTPGFSPDGRWLIFEAGSQVNRVEVTGGPVLPVTQGGDPHWGLDDLLVFNGTGGGIYSISPSGGAATAVLENVGQARPYLLPDGQAVLFQGRRDDGNRGLFLVEIGSGEVTDLDVIGDNPRYVPTGHIVFGSQSQALMAVPFDLETHRVTGQPATVLPDLTVYGGGATQFSVSDNGTAVYALSGGGQLGDGELVLADAEGNLTVSPLGPGSYQSPRFSPDGRYIAYDDGTGVRVWDTDSGSNPTLGSGRYPFWSRDGAYIYFSDNDANDVGTSDVFRVRPDGSGREHVLSRAGNQIARSISPDGDRLLVGELSADRGIDLLLVTLRPDSVTVADYLVAPWDEAFAAISPDGARAAYVSNESGIQQVYVRGFPDPVGQTSISDGFGTDPVWGPDGTTLYYRSGQEIWRVDLVDGAVGERRRLLTGNWASANRAVSNWDVHPDGDTFVLVRRPGPAAEDAASGRPVFEIEIVTNWFTELRERMGER